jgi:HEPN domain-containing protein
MSIKKKEDIMEIQSELKKAWILKSIEKAENAGALVDPELITAVFNINIIDAKKLYKHYQRGLKNVKHN